MSRCRICGADYDRDRLTSLVILRRGLRLCGGPFAVSAGAFWQPMKDELLYAPGEPRLREQAGPKQLPTRRMEMRQTSMNFHIPGNAGIATIAKIARKRLLRVVVE